LAWVIAVRGGEVGLLLRYDNRAVKMTGGDLEAIVEEFVAVVVVPHLNQRPVDEASLDEAVKVLGETIAMYDKLLQGQRREVKLVVADDPATSVPSPSSRICRFRSFGGKSIALDARSFRLTHLSLVLGLRRDLLADIGSGLPCVLTITTVGLLVGQGESVASFALGALRQL
jgi:hypothetical protein